MSKHGSHLIKVQKGKSYLFIMFVQNMIKPKLVFPTLLEICSVMVRNIVVGLLLFFTLMLLGCYYFSLPVKYAQATTSCRQLQQLFTKFNLA